ncbi:hypothetical protein [Pedobacter sp. L105]|uniref:hypothetical protein n=1 Tax=Pedobacter sp. L105 TaxID=1641871 RepID=UPI00131C4AC4|nr:hypothetical protein [Pedobacter sp. L105]
MKFSVKGIFLGLFMLACLQTSEQIITVDDGFAVNDLTTGKANVKPTPVQVLELSINQFNNK